METAELVRCSDDDLAQSIDQMQAAALAAQASMLELIAVYDARGAWRADGSTSMGAWLAGRLNTTFGHGAELARVARALSSLPALRALVGEGGLSWAQTVAVTALADADSDAGWAADAAGLGPARLAALVRRRRPPEPEVTERALRLHTDAESGWTRLWGRLPGAEGAVVSSALERLAAQVPVGADSGRPEPFDVRMADALVEMSSLSLDDDADADRACVVVHVEAAVLAGAEPGGAEVGATAVVSEAARRLACDARVEFVAERGGPFPAAPVVVGISRTSRQVPAWLGRHLRRRDGGCRFPGCGRTRWTQAHHVLHWSQGGPTDASNLLTLCHAHHRLLHEGGWRLSGNPDADVCFIRPDGRPLATGPPRLRPDVARRLLGR